LQRTPVIQECDAEVDALRTSVAQRDAEIARLQAAIAGYEQGRFIRFTRWWHNLRRRGGTGL
jgi:Tfp pilus assembly protein FimV